MTFKDNFYASDNDAFLLALIEQLAKVEILEFEEEASTAEVHGLYGTTLCPTGVVTIKITCRNKVSKKDRIDQLEEENKELNDKLNKLNEILNPCFLEEES